MERLIIFLLLVGTGFALPAQKKIDETYTISSKASVCLDLKYASKIKITAWNKSEVALKASVNLHDNAANEAWQLTNSKEDNQLKVTSEIDKKFMKKFWSGNYYKDDNGDWHSDRPHNTTEITYEIFVPNGINLKVNTYSGDIDLSGLTGTIYAKSLSGFVDMNWDSKQAASITLKSISGEVYSNLDLELQNLKKNTYVGYALKGNFKGGGTSVHLESISNNVYLRKR